MCGEEKMSKPSWAKILLLPLVVCLLLFCLLVIICVFYPSPFQNFHIFGFIKNREAIIITPLIVIIPVLFSYAYKLAGGALLREKLCFWLISKIPLSIHILFKSFPHMKCCHQILSILNKHIGCEKQLLSAFFKKYSEEESDDIGAIGANTVNRKNFIVTNFEAYSELVRAVIDKAKRKGSIVKCYTTLTIPLPKWYNYVESSTSGFPYLRSSKKWFEYIEAMKSFSEKTNVEIDRTILAVDINSKICNALSKYNNPIFFSEDKMKELSNSYILASYKTNTIPGITAPDSALKIKKEFLNNNVINKIDKYKFPNLHNIINSYNENSYNEEFFLIIPQILRADLYNCGLDIIGNYRWFPVYQVFDHEYDNSFIHIMDDNAYNEYYVHNKMPKDFFLIGYENNDWKFCFAADFDGKIDRITLEFITPTLNRQRLDDIVNSYLHPILNVRETLIDWAGR